MPTWIILTIVVGPVLVAAGVWLVVRRTTKPRGFEVLPPRDAPAGNGSDPQP